MWDVMITMIITLEFSVTLSLTVINAVLCIHEAHEARADAISYIININFQTVNQRY